jgi:hypothetical protein
VAQAGQDWKRSDLVVRNTTRWTLVAIPIAISSFVWSALAFNQNLPALVRLAFGAAALGPIVGHGLNWRNGIAAGESGVEVRMGPLRRERRTWPEVDSFALRTDRGRWRIVVLLVDEPPLTTTGAAVLNPDGRWGTTMVRRLEQFRLTSSQPGIST